jgi:hypothetical protein
VDCEKETHDSIRGIGKLSCHWRRTRGGRPIKPADTKSEGEKVVEGLKLDSIYYTQPLNMHKVNIGIEENPKFSHIGD